MRKLIPLGAILLILGLAGTAVYYKATTSTNPLEKVEASKLKELDDAARKTDKTERDAAIDPILPKLQPDYDSASDKPAFLTSLNTRLKGLPSETRLKDDGGKLVRGDDEVAPAGSTATGPVGSPTTKTKAGSGDPTPSDLLSYLRVVSKTQPEFKLNALTQPYSFSIPLDVYNDASKTAIVAGADIELKKDGLIVTDVTPVQIHLMLSMDSSRFDSAILYFKGKSGGKAFPEDTTKVAKIRVPLEESEYTPDRSKALAKALLDKIVTRTGIPAGTAGYGVKIDVRRCEIVAAP